VAIRLLARRDQTVQELRQGLARRGYPGEQVGAVIARLTSAGYLDDLSLARNWIHTRSPRRLLGPARVRQELRARGVGDAEITTALNELLAERSVRDVADEAAARRLQTLRGLPAAVARRRLAAYLERRGFARTVILAVCQSHFPDLDGLEPE
jgi:regulatory protein